MRPVKTSVAASVLAALTTSTAAMAQSHYDDQACRQYASQQVAAIQNQANAQAFGSTLLGAGLGAAIGGAVGGGRGAGIGAASGGVLGGATGIANAQNAAAYAPQQYNAYYSQCMAARTPPPPSYGAPAYAPGPRVSVIEAHLCRRVLGQALDESLDFPRREGVREGATLPPSLGASSTGPSGTDPHPPALTEGHRVVEPHARQADPRRHGS